jgi:uncharacterized protein (TIGR04255 family)
MVEAAEVHTPFGDPVPEVPLPAAPLVAVVAQVRFPPIASIAREDFIGPFQERVRSDYPVLRLEHEMGVLITPEGIRSAGDSAPVWRFLDRATAPEWKVSLASSFIALDTANYTSRKDFASRLRSLLEALVETIAPATCDRLGIRYVDRIRLDEPGVDLTSFVRPEVLGVTTTPLGEGAALLHSLSDTMYQLDDATLHGRWGRVPANARLDPFHGDAIESPSWILDLDMYSEQSSDFDVERIATTAESFARRIYRFFRWAVRPEMLRHYGGGV